MPRFRPRLKFSLLTLFVFVAILCLGLGWVATERNVIQQRQAALDLLRSKIGLSTGSPQAYWYTVELKIAEPSGIRKWLGDVTATDEQFMGVYEAEEQARISRALPEARLVRQARVELSLEEQLQLSRPQN